MKFQSVYSDPVRTSDLECLDPSLAQQQFAADADINVMLERFKVTGQMPQGFIAPSYGDFTGISDYRSAVEAVKRASDSFMDLPAHVRARFENNPQNLMAFLEDPANRSQAIDLGLVPRPVEVPSEPAKAPS